MFSCRLLALNRLRAVGLDVASMQQGMETLAVATTVLSDTVHGPVTLTRQVSSADALSPYGVLQQDCCLVNTQPVILFAHAI